MLYSNVVIYVVPWSCMIDPYVCMTLAMKSFIVIVIVIFIKWDDFRVTGPL